MDFQADNTGSAKPVSIFETLPEETRKALRVRCQEYEHFRQDLLFRLHEFSARVSRADSDARKSFDVLNTLKSGSDHLLEQLNQQPEPDEFSPDFQIRLSENFRTLDRMRLELIHLQADFPEDRSCEKTDSDNRFFELDSISLGQFFRIGTGLFLPLIVAVLLSAVLISAVIVLTFRFGL